MNARSWTGSGGAKETALEREQVMEQSGDEEKLIVGKEAPVTRVQLTVIKSATLHMNIGCVEVTLMMMYSITKCHAKSL